MEAFTSADVEADVLARRVFDYLFVRLTLLGILKFIHGIVISTDVELSPNRLFFSLLYAYD